MVKCPDRGVDLISKLQNMRSEMIAAGCGRWNRITADARQEIIRLREEVEQLRNELNSIEIID